MMKKIALVLFLASSFSIFAHSGKVVFNGQGDFQMKGGLSGDYQTEIEFQKVAKGKLSMMSYVKTDHGSRSMTLFLEKSGEEGEHSFDITGENGEQGVGNCFKNLDGGKKSMICQLKVKSSFRGMDVYSYQTMAFMGKNLYNSGMMTIKAAEDDHQHIFHQGSLQLVSEKDCGDDCGDDCGGDDCGDDCSTEKDEAVVRILADFFI